MISATDSLWVSGWGTDATVWCGLCDDVPPAADFSGAQTPGQLVDAVVRGAESRQATTLVGWSLGGMLVLAAAARVPSLRRCVLIGTAPNFVRCDGATGWPASVVQRMRAACRRDPMGTWAHFMSEHLGGCEIAAGNCEPDLLDAGLAFLETADLRQEAAGLAVPTLWLHGAEDSLFCPPGLPGAQAFLPHAPLTYHCYDGLGHAPFLDDPRRCRRDLTTFFDTCDAQQRTDSPTL